MGETGDKGLPGRKIVSQNTLSKGKKGEKGKPGEKGTKGANGAIGEKGSFGGQGFNGDKGKKKITIVSYFTIYTRKHKLFRNEKF